MEVITLALEDFNLDFEAYDKCSSTSIKMATDYLIYLSDDWEREQLLISQSILLANKPKRVKS